MYLGCYRISVSSLLDWLVVSSLLDWLVVSSLLDWLDRGIN